MKRTLNILSLCATICTVLLSVGCEVKPLPAGSLVVNSGIVSNRLEIDGREGASTTFVITSKYNWEIAHCDGVRFEPSYGEAGNNIAITATALQANNTMEVVRLGDVTFIVEKTRFVGIEAYQRPQVIVERNNERIVWVDANAGAEASFDVICSDLDFEVVAKGNITCKAANTDITKKRFRVTAQATTDNLSNEEPTIGHVEFEVEGVRQVGSVEVCQHKALRTDASSVKINGTAGSEYTFSIETPFSFEVTSTSQAISFTKSGNDIKITALADNHDDKDALLGEIIISLAENSACREHVKVWQRPHKAQHTMMIYMLGTALQSYFQSNVRMILSALEADILGSSRIIIFSQNTTQTGELFEAQYDAATGKASTHSLGTIDLPIHYNEQMFSDILSRMAKEAPAHKYSLLFGSHGRGWLPKESSTTMSRAGGDRIKRIWTPLPGMPEIRHMGDSSSTQINTDEFGRAVVNAGLYFEFIVMDCCYMSNVEALYDMRHAARHILASPCEVMAAGFPYNEIIPLLINIENYNLDAAARRFVDFYSSNHTSSRISACVAVTDCGQLEALATVMKGVNAAVNKPYSADDVQPYDGVHFLNNPTHIFFDLEDFVMRSCADEQQVNAFIKQLDKTVASRYHTPTFFSVYNGLDNPINHYSGITTSAPIESNRSSAYIDEWRETAWYKATH